MSTPADLEAAILDSVSAHIAVLDESGRIVAVNAAWRRFARDNFALSAAEVDVGADYLAACGRAVQQGDLLAGQALLGIRAVMHGEREQFSLEYPCHAPEEQRWFQMNVTPLRKGGGVVIAHENITRRKQAEALLLQSHDELEQRVRERTAALERANAQLKQEIAERQAAQQRSKQAAIVFESANEAIMIADASHAIISVNRAFTAITGYTEAEVLGRNPGLMKSGRHSDLFYQTLWADLERAGQWQGEIWNRRKNGELYPAWESISAIRDERGQVSHYVSIFSDISEIKQAEERLTHLAHHDPLTGLANRLLLVARLEQALERAKRRQTRVALLILDMDHFKLINETAGHLVGDRYLQGIAQRLTASVRSEDTVARLGGDEFAIIAEELGHAEDAGTLAAKLNQVLSQPMLVEDHEITPSGSIGIGLFPDDAQDCEGLLKAADSAMFHAKAEGRQGYRYYKSELSEQALARLTLENGLRQALGRGEFVVYYQPLVSLESRRCVGVEALLRWRHPQRGLLLPETFIPVAEDSRLIQPMGYWVLRQACSDLMAWRAQGIWPMRLAVNVSWRQFLDDQFSERVHAILDEYRLGPEDLEIDLEITESVLQSNERAIEALTCLRGSGVRVVVDDFGTGYSSLGQLKKLPVDGLKIDKSFLRDIDRDAGNRAIVSAITAMAHSLGLLLVGEGVETAAQLKFLRELGCHYAQGYLLGHPMPAEQIPEVHARGCDLDALL